MGVCRWNYLWNQEKKRRKLNILESSLTSEVDSDIIYGLNKTMVGIISLIKSESPRLSCWYSPDRVTYHLLSVETGHPLIPEGQ